MKKQMVIITLALICAALLVMSAFAIDLNNLISDSYSDGSLHQNIDTFLNMGFSVITSQEVATCTEEHGVSNDVIDTALNGNIVFFADTLATYESCADDIAESIYAGNVVAVYDPNGIAASFEEMLQLPLACTQPETTANVEEQRDLIYLVIGKIYSADSNGHIYIKSLNVPLDTSKEEIFDLFCSQLRTFSEEENVCRHGGVEAYALSGNYIFIGTCDYYYSGTNKKGDLQAVYDIYTVQDLNNYDYYAIHAYVTGTPGDAKYSNGYDGDILYSSFGTYSSNAVLYKHGPNTTESNTTYSVDLGISGTKNGSPIDFKFGWSKSITDVTIGKTLKDNTNCEWTCDINDWKRVADYSWTFEPGGVIRVPSTTTSLLLNTSNRFTVDKWNESPSLAASGSSIISITPNNVTKVIKN